MSHYEGHVDPYESILSTYQSGSDPTLGGITGPDDLNISVPSEHQKYLWEYDPYEEEAIRAGAYGDIEGQYADARTQMMKARQPSKAGGSFAGAGSSLLDMTTQDLYEDVGRGTRGTMLDMMTDITGKRKEYREDIIDRLMQIQEVRGEEFETARRTRGTTRTTESGLTEYWMGNKWVSQEEWDAYIQDMEDAYDDDYWGDPYG